MKVRSNIAGSRESFHPRGSRASMVPCSESSRPAKPEQPPGEAANDRQTRHWTSGPFRFAAQTEESKPAAAAEDSPSDQPEKEPQKAPRIGRRADGRGSEGKGSHCHLTRAQRLMIASDDVAALDEFERQLNMLAEGSTRIARN